MSIINVRIILHNRSRNAVRKIKKQKDYFKQKTVK